MFKNDQNKFLTKFELFVLNLRRHIDLSIYNHRRLMVPLSDISGLSSRLSLSCLVVISTSLVISTLPGLSTLLFYHYRISLILRPDRLRQKWCIIICNRVILFLSFLLILILLISDYNRF